MTTAGWGRAWAPARVGRIEAGSLGGSKNWQLIQPLASSTAEQVGRRKSSAPPGGTHKAAAWQELDGDVVCLWVARVSRPDDQAVGAATQDAQLQQQACTGRLRGRAISGRGRSAARAAAAPAQPGPREWCAPAHSARAALSLAPAHRPCRPGGRQRGRMVSRAWLVPAGWAGTGLGGVALAHAGVAMRLTSLSIRLARNFQRIKT